MAISWITTALKFVPWGDVVSAAPTVARGARDLWRTVRHNDDEAVVPPESVAVAPPQDRVVALASRLEAVESRLQSLQQEAGASAELMTSLAEQNERLVQAVEILRARTRLLLWACALLGAAAAALAWRVLS